MNDDPENRGVTTQKTVSPGVESWLWQDCDENKVPGMLFVTKTQGVDLISTRVHYNGIFFGVHHLIYVHFSISENI